jgi:glucose-6-phosphate isomerase
VPVSRTGARINSFDRWDVALGEVTAKELVPELQSDEAPYDAGSSTNAHPPAP